MFARIYQPARNVMQSGAGARLGREHSGHAKSWVLEFTPARARGHDALMGWTSSADMNGQVSLRFARQMDAVAYAKANGIAYRVEPARRRAPIIRAGGYAENFATARRDVWTH